jgi:DNA-binding IclR family transcriptional regulator
MPIILAMKRSHNPRKAASAGANPKTDPASIARTKTPRQRRSESSGDRLLSVLELFSDDQPAWTAEEAAQRLQTSVPTAYRYFKSLAKVGLIDPSSRAGYTLGPAIIEMDRQIRLRDPLLSVGRRVMEDLIRYSPEGSAILLCRVFQDRVICIHQVVGPGPQVQVSYERGRPMPLFRGATAKVVLANLPARTLRRLFEEHTKEIKAAGLGQNLEEFKKTLGAIRRTGVCVTRGEVDPGRAGIAAPIFSTDGSVLGSLSSVLPAYRADETLVGRIVPLTTAGAREIERGMQTGEVSRMEPARRTKMR